MNLSVYIPDNLKSRLDCYVESKGMTTNGAIRKAVELLLETESNKQWGDWINQLESDAEFTDVDELRIDLKQPKENLF